MSKIEQTLRLTFVGEVHPSDSRRLRGRLFSELFRPDQDAFDPDAVPVRTPLLGSWG